MIKIILSLVFFVSCSTSMKTDCPIRKKGLTCHQKVMESALANRVSKKDALEGFKHCCEKYKYKNSCKEVENYN